MSTKVTNIIGGPALVTFAGATFYSKGDIILENALEVFGIDTDRFRKVDDRVSGQPVRLRFTPAGAWAALAVLFPYAATLLGDLATPVRTLNVVDATSDTSTILGADLPAGTAVMLSSSGTLPAGLDDATLYYIGIPTPGSVKFYDTRAHAIADSSGGLVNITDTGTGTHKMIVQEPLVINTFDGYRYTFHNSAVMQMPPITGSAIATLLGEVVFEAFLRNGMNWGDANSLFTADTNPLSDTSFDPTAILTQPYVVAWGSAPWDALSTKTGVQVSFNLAWEPVDTDTDGTVTRRLSGLEVMARAQPIGISSDDLLAKMLLQGSGAKRGRSLSGDNLNISSTGVYLRLYGAALRGGNHQFSSKLDRVGELTWAATRTFADGVPNPLFFVGTASPD